MYCNFHTPILGFLEFYLTTSRFFQNSYLFLCNLFAKSSSRYSDKIIKPILVRGQKGSHQHIPFYCFQKHLPFAAFLQISIFLSLSPSQPPIALFFLIPSISCKSHFRLMPYLHYCLSSIIICNRRGLFQNFRFLFFKHHFDFSCTF